jgi:hypothetical protein
MIFKKIFRKIIIKELRFLKTINRICLGVKKSPIKNTIDTNIRYRDRNRSSQHFYFPVKNLSVPCYVTHYIKRWGEMSVMRYFKKKNTSGASPKGQTLCRRARE